MLEIPALAMVLAGIAILCWDRRDFTGGNGDNGGNFTEGNEENEGGEAALTPRLRQGFGAASAEREINCALVFRRNGWVVIAGVVFGLGLQVKLVPIIYLPLAGVVVLLQGLGKRDWLKRAAVQMVVFGAGLVMAYIGSDLLIERGAYLTHFGQSWKSHFGAVKASAEYGSPRQHPFEWIVLLKNWDATVPAVIGVLGLLAKLQKGFNRNAGKIEGGGKLFTEGNEGNEGLTKERKRRRCGR